MSSLNAFNYLNLVGYIVNTFVTFAASPIFGFPDNAELSQTYQTIVTPSGSTFAIWGVIFIAQAVFSILQMLPKYRDAKLVQEGVSYWYFVACMFQSAWTFAFGYEIMPLSSFFMGGILVSLIMIVLNQSKIESEKEKRIEEFWLYKFPFSIHCGWIFAAFAVNLNVTILSLGADAITLSQWGFVTFGYIGLVAAFALLYLNPPDFTIPSVLVWATIGIASELKEPSQQIANTFEEDFLNLFRDLTIGICVILALLTAAYGALRVIKQRKEEEGINSYDGAELPATV